VAGGFMNDYSDMGLWVTVVTATLCCVSCVIAGQLTSNEWAMHLRKGVWRMWYFLIAISVLIAFKFQPTKVQW